MPNQVPRSEPVSKPAPAIDYELVLDVVAEAIGDYQPYVIAPDGILVAVTDPKANRDYAALVNTIESEALVRVQAVLTSPARTVAGKEAIVFVFSGYSTPDRLLAVYAPVYETPITH